MVVAAPASLFSSLGYWPALGKLTVKLVMPPPVTAGDLASSDAAITRLRYSISMDWVEERVLRKPGDCDAT